MEAGDTFGRWEVITLDAPGYKGHIQVRVRCRCGSERDIPRSYLTREHRPSQRCQTCAKKLSARQRFGTKKVWDDDLDD